MSERTITHYYPAEEVEAMSTFYDGKKCIITQQTVAVQWAHMLDAALRLEPSNRRLRWMLDRNLRQERNSRHAAELRENLVPLSSDSHVHIDTRPATATLFLHEDLLARTLAFELELQQWRRMELQAGRGDPGRPQYEEVFEVFGPTIHRWHSTEPRFRYGTSILYNPIDCPGVYPNSANPFPEISTLLSIPFSVLHNSPRLISIVPLSKYQEDLIAMSAHIIRLWSWDPSSEELAHSEAIAVANGGIITARTPKPLPIQHPSRQCTVYASMQLPPPPVIMHASLPACRPTSGSSMTSDKGVFVLQSGEVLLGVAPCVSWEYENGLQATVGTDEQSKMYSVEWERLSMKGSTWVDSELSEGSSEAQDVETEHCGQTLSSTDILDWSGRIDNKTTWQCSPLPPTSFEKGVMGSMSVNDILMVRGLIDPGVYVHYLDLSSFS